MACGGPRQIKPGPGQRPAARARWQAPSPRQSRQPSSPHP